MTIWTKDPNDVLWFQFNWSQFLATGETISTATVTPSGSITVVSSNVSGGNLVNVNVSGGVASATSAPSLAIRIVTSAGNTYYAQKQIQVLERFV
jgi:hypothetical protein